MRGRIVCCAETVQNRLPLTLSAERPQDGPRKALGRPPVYLRRLPAASGSVSSQGLAGAPARLLPPFSLECFHTVMDFLRPHVRPCHPLPEDLSLGCPLSRKQTLSPQTGGRGGTGLSPFLLLVPILPCPRARWRARHLPHAGTRPVLSPSPVLSVLGPQLSFLEFTTYIQIVLCTVQSLFNLFSGLTLK